MRGRSPGVFTCSVVRRGDDVGVDVIGAVDDSSVGQLRNQLLTVAKEHPRSIHVDLAGASLPERRSIAVFVEVWRFASEHGIELAVRCPSAALERTFDVAPSGELLTLRN